MSFENRAFEGQKKFTDPGSSQTIEFQKSKTTKREIILIVALIVILILAIVFLVLFVKEKDRKENEGPSSGKANQSLIFVFFAAIELL